MYIDIHWRHLMKIKDEIGFIRKSTETLVTLFSMSGNGIELAIYNSAFEV